MDVSALQFNAANPQAWGERVVHGSATEAERLAATTQEFEAVLLRQYLNDALKPLNTNGPGMGGNNAVYGYLINDALASSLTKGGVFGFSNLMQAQLSSSTGVNDDDTNANL